MNNEIEIEKIKEKFNFYAFGEAN